MRIRPPTTRIHGSGTVSIGRKINPAHNPSARAGYGYAYDQIRNNTLVFGGFFNDASTSTYFGDTWTLSGAATPTPTTAVTITVPAGVQFSFNSVTYTGSQTVNIAPGLYTLSTSATQSIGVGTQAVFTPWSDRRDYTQRERGRIRCEHHGNFRNSILLTTIASPAGDGTVAGGGFYNAGTAATVTATANTGFGFSNWSGACSGSGACSVTMSAPASVTANFAATSVQFTINVPAGIQFSFNGTTYTGTQTVTLGPGSNPLSTTTPQSTGVGIQAAFASWSDGGAIAHNVSAHAFQCNRSQVISILNIC